MPYKDAARQREYQRVWTARRRAEYFDGKTCELCGSTLQLELHHRDPNRKVHHAIWSWGEARRLAEIAKCFVVCADCHRAQHNGARRLEAELRNPHGTVQRYKLGCRCQDCRAGNRDYQRARKPAA